MRLKPQNFHFEQGDCAMVNVKSLSWLIKVTNFQWSWSAKKEDHHFDDDDDGDQNNDDDDADDDDDG